MPDARHDGAGEVDSRDDVVQLVLHTIREQGHGPEGGNKVPLQAVRVLERAATATSGSDTQWQQQH